MAKRRCDVSVSQTKFSYSDASYSDSENEHTFEPVNKKKGMFALQPTLVEVKHNDQKCCLNEESEHTYSTTPIFNYLPAATEKTNYSSDSDYGNYQQRFTRGVERSTSESSRSDGKGKRVGNKFKKQTKCYSRNAVMARMNRQRKKEYVEKLESEINELREDNVNLKSRLDAKKEVLKTLNKQVQYLRCALLNSKDIGLLLKRIHGDKTGLNVTSSLLNTPPPVSRFNLPDINFSEGNLSSPTYTDNLGYSPDYLCDDIGLSITSPNYVSNEYNDLGLSVPLPDSFDDFNNFSFFNYPDENKFDWSGFPAVDSIINTDMFGLGEAPSSGIADIEPLQQFGVCLHVSNNQVSLEFCDLCCHSASTGV